MEQNLPKMWLIVVIDKQLTQTCFRMSNIFGHIVIKEWFAEFAVLSHSIVLTVIANTARYSSRIFINSFVEMARVCVIVTNTRSTSVRLLSNSWFPRKIIVEVLTFFAIQSRSIMSTLASAVHHVFLIRDSRKRKASRRVTVTGTRSANHYVLDGIVIFLSNLCAVVEKIVS